MKFFTRRNLRLVKAKCVRIIRGYYIRQGRIKYGKYEIESKKIENILVVYFIPRDSPRYGAWSDGFTKSIDILSEDYSIEYVNIADGFPEIAYLEEFDFVLLKSNWNWGPDKEIRKRYTKVKTKIGLAISGVSIPPSLIDMMFYDVLFYETDWYRRFIANHPLVFKAFGIDVDAIVGNKTEEIEIKYDYLSIGALLPHKRLEKLTTKKGAKAVVGEYYVGKSEEIVEMLKLSSVDVLSYVSYSEMSKHIQSARVVYIPAAIDGGGERAVLEARCLGVPVEVESDNPKLLELTLGEIPDDITYAKQLSKGLKSL